MKYKFSDMMDESVYQKNKVMFVTGQYSVFNNFVIDKFRDACKGSNDFNPDDPLLQEFNVSAEQVEVSNTVDLNTFMQINAMPAMSGKWFCNVGLETMSKKQLDWLKEYIKKPEDTSVLVIYSTEYKNYRLWLTNKLVAGGQDVGIIQLSFPHRDTLYKLVRKLFADRNASIENSALDLFIQRMSNSYDDYEIIIDKICTSALPEGFRTMKPSELPIITYSQAFEALKGIENFALDDFVDKITEPLTSESISGRKPVYKMMGYLVEEYGARKLVAILASKIDELIEFRDAINKGYIPIIVNFNVDEAKKLLGEESKIAGKSDYMFRKLAKTASKTSLQDWVYMRLMLSNVNKFDETSYNRALFSLVARSSLTPSRIDNDIGIDSIFRLDMQNINNIAYVDNK